MLSLVSPSDHDLGQRLGQLIQQGGETAFEAGVLSRRLQAQLQDLLGADTTLFNPLRDLLQRPGFRQLFHPSNPGQALHGRDALLRDLAEVYSPTVLRRLDAVLQGCLNLPASDSIWSSPQPSAPRASTVSAPQPATVVTVATPRQQGVSSLVIGLLALVCGALVMALTGVLITTNRTSNVTSTVPSAPAPSSQTSPPVAPALPEREPLGSASPSSAGQWQACLDNSGGDGPPPQAGETWWPVVGPGEALDAARRHCRADAFTNGSGNVQVASFRDRSTATAFAEQLTNDNSHPYSFWVGDATER